MAKNETEETPTIGTPPEEPTLKREGPEGEVNTDITLGDFQIILNLIDLASARGAFRGAELTPVGNVYSKLEAFLRQTTEAQAEAEETTTRI